ncbi:hypothetical protein F5J12DRAFT_786396 [Pisolithus orientalis]|uniref:uncharacterized protein n=1 Tax=Pisolithus orientalis TaxID=936130 RepID=UPI0022241D89|nr:uncharacterized protein F5J12DRAFT_786396 [Pisolithus orientalis]KAI5991060.1 hypothetical protein F5J12DRAFT_786396 [Pisolithus orientalis]
MATSSMLGHIPALCRWAMMGAWIMAGSWNIQLASFHASISGPDGSQPPGYFQWFGKHTSGILLGWYDFLTFPVSWVRSHVIAMVQKAFQWDGIGLWAGGSCLASILNQLQLARMDDTLWAVYSGSEGTPMGFYWAGICSGKVQSAGPNSQLMTITQDTYQPYDRGPGQMPSLW